jgi:hypothetical protein
MLHAKGEVRSAASRDVRTAPPHLLRAPASSIPRVLGPRGSFIEPTSFSAVSDSEPGWATYVTSS